VTTSVSIPIDLRRSATTSAMWRVLPKYESTTTSADVRAPQAGMPTVRLSRSSKQGRRSCFMSILTMPGSFMWEHRSCGHEQLPADVLSRRRRTRVGEGNTAADERPDFSAAARAGRCQFSPGDWRAVAKEMIARL
jgi:hypothetical protein